MHYLTAACIYREGTTVRIPNDGQPVKRLTHVQHDLAEVLQGVRIPLPTGVLAHRFANYCVSPLALPVSTEDKRSNDPSVSVPG
jgi:hypothetical protein